MAIARTETRRVLSFGLVFAVVCTAVWAGAFASQSDTAHASAQVRAIINFGGGYLSSLAQDLLRVAGQGFRPHWLAWALYGSTEFVGAFLQGLGYAVLGLAFRRGWRANPARAVACALAVVAVLAVSYRVGSAVHDRAHCISRVERSGDGIGTFTECGASAFGSGQMWMTAVFAIVVVVALFRPRSAETHPELGD